jgi:hypothetical protein
VEIVALLALGFVAYQATRPGAITHAGQDKSGNSPKMPDLPGAIGQIGNALGDLAVATFGGNHWERVLSTGGDITITAPDPRLVQLDGKTPWPHADGKHKVPTLVVFKAYPQKVFVASKWWAIDSWPCEIREQGAATETTVSAHVAGGGVTVGPGRPIS